jgi:hypothetical protein
LAILELFGWLTYFRERRLGENRSQKELFKQEIKLIALAILTILVLMGSLFAVARWILP